MRKNTIFKISGLVLGDIVIVITIYFLSFVLIIKDLSDNLLIIIGLSLAIKITIYAIFRLYNMLLRHVGATEFIRICFAVFLSNILIFSLFRLVNLNDMDWVAFFYSTPLEVLLMSLTRFIYRIYHWITTRRYFTNGHKFINTLIVGAGSAGKFVYEEIQKNDQLHNKVIAFIDDSREKQYNRLNGITILGPIDNIATYIDKYKIKEVIIAIANIDKLRLSEIIEIVSTRSVKIKRLPLLLEDTSKVRKIVDVNIDDLLNRGVITLDNNGLKQLIKGKSVLVTGGGGSIGSELCYQILSLNPHTLIMFDIYENTTYETQIELEKIIKSEQLATRLIVVIGSVYNYDRINDVFEKHKPQLVFHAAAYKHVPLMEFNSIEAVRTNIIGTYNVAKIADEYQVEKMIMVSSDKAVRPTNVMGATKAFCEKIIQYFDTVSTTDYSAVRFGNVLGSHGSVIPLFKKQIEAGGPVTITHPEITRFFMTISEAVSLILQSAIYAKGGEIFILDMGEPVKITELADKIIRLSGLIPNKDIKIEFIGLRAGEKLYEELLLDISKHHKTANDKIYIEEKKEIINIEKHIEEIKKNIDKITNQEVKEMLHRIDSSYNIKYIPELM